MQRQQLEAKLQKQSDHMESELKEQSEQLKEQIGQFEAKLNQHSEKQSEQFQEAVRQLSECHKVYYSVLYNYSRSTNVIIDPQVMGACTYGLRIGSDVQ